MRWNFCACACVVAAGQHADPPALRATATDDRIERLESRLQEQQQHIENLRTQLAQADSQSLDQARAEAMRAQIREILSEREFRESLMPSTTTAGYDGGFYIRSTDEAFRLNFNGLLQFRWTHYETQRVNRYLMPGFNRDDRTGFDFNRVRFTASGYAGSSDLTYYMQFGADAAGSYNTGLYYAWINYRFADELQSRVGLFDLASTRNTMNDDAAQHFVDRPLFDAVFGLGTGLGVRVWGLTLEKRLEYYVDLVNSTADGENTAAGRTITTDPPELDGNPALLARAVWHARGDNPPNDFLLESDLEYHTAPALDLGLHYAFNDVQYDATTTRLPIPISSGANEGGFGLVTSRGTQINQFGTDAAFKYRGFSALAEYVVRLIDPRRAFREPFTAFSVPTNETSTVAQHGAMLSVGYFLPIPGWEKKLEVVGRIGGISALAEEQEGVWEYGAGLNYYIQGNSLKLQADVSRVYEAPITSTYSSLANVNDEALVFRVQLQLAF